MRENWDLGVGGGGTFATISLAGVNAGLAAACGALTLFILALRARREWRKRDEPPTDR